MFEIGLREAFDRHGLNLVLFDKTKDLRTGVKLESTVDLPTAGYIIVAVSIDPFEFEGKVRDMLVAVFDVKSCWPKMHAAYFNSSPMLGVNGGEIMNANGDDGVLANLVQCVKNCYYVRRGRESSCKWPS